MQGIEVNPSYILTILNMQVMLLKQITAVENG
jgi:hypothetical protein